MIKVSSYKLNKVAVISYCLVYFIIIAFSLNVMICYTTYLLRNVLFLEVDKAKVYLLR